MKSLFKSHKETVRTVRYVEHVQEGDSKVVGTLYIQKDVVSRLGNPTKIRVTLEPAE